MNVTSTIVGMLEEMNGKPVTTFVLLCLTGAAIYTWNTHAKAEDIEEVKQQVVQNQKSIQKLLVLQLADNLRTLHIEQCASETLQRRIDLAEAIDNLQVDYRELTGDEYELGPCQ